MHQDECTNKFKPKINFIYFRIKIRLNASVNTINLRKLNKPIKFIIKRWNIKLGCYKSLPLTGISSRDSGLASKEIWICLLQLFFLLRASPPERHPGIQTPREYHPWV